MKRIVLFAAAIALTAGAAQASQQGYYFSGIAGASLMPNQTLRGLGGGGVNSSFDAGYAFGGAAGWDSGQGWRVELSSVHQLSGVDRVNGTLQSGHLQSTSLMLNGTYDLMQDSPVVPYVGAGLGFQDIGASINGFHGSDEWEPAYQLEAGVRHDIDDHFSIFGEYRYSQSEAARLRDMTDLGNQHFSDNAILTGITYHIGEY
jgi:OmpA-OmpF porin, OOP family